MAMHRSPPSLCQLIAFKLKSRRPHACRANSDLFLNPLDELHKLRDRIHAQQRQEPAIEFKCLIVFSRARQIEERDRLGRKCIHQAGNPANGSCVHFFHDRIVYTDENAETISEQAADRCDSTNIRARLFYRVQILMRTGELRDLLRVEVCPVGDGIVVQHAGERRSRKNGRYMRPHLAPVAGVDIGRQHH